MKPVELKGRRIGRLLYIERIGKLPSGHIGWKARCDCGSEVVMPSYRARRTKSCGCLSKDVTSARSKTHGKTKTKTFKVWGQMRRRCREKASYVNISVHPRWDTFESFLADMGECPEGMTLDRIDPAGDYTPENCRWATPKQQANNRTNNCLISRNGVTKTAAEWADITGILAQTLRWRFKRGWSEDEIFRQPK